MAKSNPMTQEAFRRIQGAIAKKQEGKIQKKSSLAKLQGKLDKFISTGGKK